MSHSREASGSVGIVLGQPSVYSKCCGILASAASRRRVPALATITAWRSSSVSQCGATSPASASAETETSTPPPSRPRPGIPPGFPSTLSLLRDRVTNSGRRNNTKPAKTHKPCTPREAQSHSLRGTEHVVCGPVENGVPVQPLGAPRKAGQFWLRFRYGRFGTIRTFLSADALADKMV